MAFYKLFTFLFGEKLFSKKKILSSTLISISSLVLFTLIFGVNNSGSGTLFKIIFEITDSCSKKDFGYFFIITMFLMIPVMLNIIPDYFSYHITYVLFRKTVQSQSSNKLKYFLLDFTISSLIFLLGLFVYFIFFLCSAVIFYYIEYGSIQYIQEYVREFFSNVNPITFKVILRDISQIIRIIFTPSGLLIFYITTMVTSLLFWLYLIECVFKWGKNKLSTK